MDVYIAIRGGGNASEMSDVDQKKMNDYNLVKKPIRDERLSKRWCLTQFPAPENAQRASMSTEEYENFVWDAIIRDWDVQKNHQQKLRENSKGVGKLANSTFGILLILLTNSSADKGINLFDIINLYHKILKSTKN